METLNQGFYRGSCRHTHIHGCRAALIITTIPALTAAGRLSHAATTVARSSGMCDTHMTHFACKEVSPKCADVYGPCAEGQGEDPLSVRFCSVCVSGMSHSCWQEKCRRGDLNPHALSG